MFEKRNYISSSDINSRFILSQHIKKYINKKIDKYSDVVVFCIGTDRATGDALGPLVGTSLENKGLKNVYGTIDTPIHAINLSEKVKKVYEFYEKPFIIAIDACLGVNHHIGNMSIWEGAISPGAGISKNLIEVGDIAITGIVNRWSYNGIFQLQSTRLSIVMKMAEIISDSIEESIKNIY